MKPIGRVVDRFMDRVDITREGCWPWEGETHRDGYGLLAVAPQSPGAPWKRRRAHRIAYELFEGPIGPGMEIDHLCGWKLCVNPDHLEAVTPAENRRRQFSANRAKTHCPSGHPYDERNTYTNPNSGYRYCRACLQKRQHGGYS